MTSISTRISIAWPPDIPPSENTDTLVLNFPSNHFIDLRPLKSMNALDWGMAGHQIMTETPDGLKMTFIHTVDSRVPEDPLSVKDEGLFNKLANGDDLETGAMMNPDTRRVMVYEEIWRNTPVNGNFVLLESVAAENKTFVGIIGEYYQGIGTTEGTVNAKRCELKDGKWVTRFSVGDESTLPVFQYRDEWKEGEEIELEGKLWKIRDCGTWKSGAKVNAQPEH